VEHRRVKCTQWNGTRTGSQVALHASASLISERCAPLPLSSTRSLSSRLLPVAHFAFAFSVPLRLFAYTHQSILTAAFESFPPSRRASLCMRLRTKRIGRV
jgi:hypothetical protein